MSDYITYRIEDSAGRIYYVTTDMMDVENLWYRGNSNLSLSEDGTQYTTRRSLVANSKLISNPATGGGSTTYTMIRSIEAIGSTDGSITSWSTVVVIGIIAVTVIFMFFRGRKKTWKNL